MLPPASPPGNPHAEKLLPATVDELQAVGLKPRKVAMDGGFLVRCNYGLSRTPNRPRRTAGPRRRLASFSPRPPLNHRP